MPSKIRKLIAWVKALRIRTLPLSISSILAGNAFVINEFNWTIFYLSFLTTILLQVLANFANDYGDSLKGIDNQQRLGPQRTVQSGEIDASEMRKAIFLTSFFSLISGLVLIYISLKNQLETFILFLVIGLLAIWAAIQYTVGKKPYGYNSLGDFFVWFFFGIVGVVGSHFLQTKYVTLEIFYIANAIGFWSVSVLNLNNIRDLENDKKCGKITLAVRLTFKNARIYQLFLTILSFTLTASICIQVIGFLKSSPILFLSVIPIVISYYSLWIKKTPQAYDVALKFIALNTFFVSLFMFIIFRI
jgi:1,4-dihydroxy-2-naphthoate octaprenyltransferase